MTAAGGFFRSGETVLAQAGSNDLPYMLGDLLAVPLRDGGYAIGLVARADWRGRVLGYFFGPRLSEVPTSGYFLQPVRQDATLIAIFGDLGLLQKRWKVFFRANNWTPESWPIPVFCRNGRLKVSYGDSLEVASEELLSEGDCSNLPEDGLAGAGYIEIKLSRLL